MNRMVDLYLATAACTTRRASSFFYHSLNGSSGRVNCDLQFLWRWANFNSLQNQYPWTNRQKIGTVDYVRDGTHYTKVDTNLPTEGFWANEWIIKKNIFICIFFSQAGTQVRPVEGFLYAIAQKTWNHAKMCLFGVMKLKFNFKPLLIVPKSVKFWHKTGQFFRLKNA